MRLDRNEQLQQRYVKQYSTASAESLGNGSNISDIYHVRYCYVEYERAFAAKTIEAWSVLC